MPGETGDAGKHGHAATPHGEAEGGKCNNAAFMFFTHHYDCRYIVQVGS